MAWATSSLLDLLKGAGRLIYLHVWPFIKRHAFAVACLVIAIVFIANAWGIYDKLRTREFVLLTGPSGSESDREAEEFASELEGKSTWWGRNYKVRIEPTDGFEATRKRVGSDLEGKYFGFAHDGFGDPENLGILVPMAHSSLHIVASRFFLKKHLPSCKRVVTFPAIHFKDLVPYLSACRGRVFLGHNDSGTRQMSEIVLRHFHLNPGQLQSYGIANWNEVRAALNDGQIDLAFLHAPEGSGILTEIASDDSAVLVGLNGNRDAIQQGQTHISKSVLHANAYRHGDFATGAIETIASRKVLIASNAISESEAYTIAMACRNSLRSELANPKWDGKATTDFLDTYSYPRHVAAAAAVNGKPPSAWMGSFAVLMPVAILVVAAEAVQAVNRRLDKNSNVAPTVPLPSPAYTDLLNAVEERLTLLVARTNLLSKDEARLERRQLNKWRKEARLMSAADTITDKQHDILSAALQELQAEIDLNTDPGPPGAPPGSPSPKPSAAKKSLLKKTRTPR